MIKDNEMEGGSAARVCRLDSLVILAFRGSQNANTYYVERQKKQPLIMQITLI